MSGLSVRLIPIYLKKREEAIKLRGKGWSYKELAQKFRVSKSTAYLWTRKVKLSELAQRRIQRKINEALKRGLIAYNKVHSRIRSQEAAKIREGYKEQALKEILREVKKLSLRDLKLIGLALYWAEGSKKSRNSTDFSNSDPFIIQTAMRFFREVCRLPEEKIKAKIHLYPQIDPKEAIFIGQQLQNYL